MDEHKRQAMRIAKRVKDFPEHTAEELDEPVADNFFAGDPSKVTNPSARKFLGVAGYLFAETIASQKDNETITSWTRGTDMLLLYENPNKNPVLTDRNGKGVSWKQLGTRNPVVSIENENR